MSNPEFDEEQYVLGMHDRGVLVFPKGGKKLKSGRISPYYHNQRPILSHKRSLDTEGVMSIDKQRDLIRNTARGYTQRFFEIKTPFHHVFGKAQAGTATIAVAAYEAGLSYLWERIPEEKKKHYGVKQMVEGDFDYGDFVHLADDNTTDGESKIEGAAVLFKVGLQPVSLTVAFDREEGARERLEQLGYEMNAVTSLSAAIPILRENNRITDDHVAAVVAYHERLIADGVTSTFKLAA